MLGTAAVLAVYDVWFRAEMKDVEAFAEWMRTECADRYPAVAKNRFTEASLAEVGFTPVWQEDLRVEHPVTLESLVAYLMTHSERLAAVREGREAEADQARFLTEGLSPLFRDEPVRKVGFGIAIEVFERPQRAAT